MSPDLKQMASPRGTLSHRGTCARLLWLVAGFLVVSIPPAVANPFVLKCNSSTGEPTVDMNVDLDRIMINWGNNYKITKVTDRYITTIQNEQVMLSDVGGEVLVLDRISGAYKYAAVGLYCDQKPPLCTSNSVFGVLTLSGKCVLPVL